MVTIIFILLLTINLVEMICFGGNILWGTIAVLVSVVFVGLKLILKDKFAKLFYALYAVAGFAVIFFCMTLPRADGADGGIVEYNKEINKAAEQIANGKIKNAETILARVGEKYSEYTEEIVFLKIVMLIDEGHMEDASRLLSRVGDSDSRIYCAIKEKLLMDDVSTTDSQLYNFYMKAAKANPNWAYIVRKAGICEYNEGNYNQAYYWLLTADRLEPGDCVTEYFLGAVCYKQYDYDNALMYFDLAVEHKADDTILNNIAWYLDDMGYWNTGV